MRRSIALTLTAMFLAASLALADPAVRVDYHEGVPQVQLEGNWAGSFYTVYRSRALDGPFELVSGRDTPCTGECAIDDYAASPGSTYWYRFDLARGDGGFESYGPYAVTISNELAWRANATVYPNPGNGATRVQLFLAGAPGAPPLNAEASLYDLQGRMVRALHKGPLSRGTTRVEWDGRDRDGRTLGAGVYYLRFASPLGSTVTRVVRVR